MEYNMLIFSLAMLHRGGAADIGELGQSSKLTWQWSGLREKVIHNPKKDVVKGRM